MPPMNVLRRKNPKPMLPQRQLLSGLHHQAATPSYDGPKFPVQPRMFPDRLGNEPPYPAAQMAMHGAVVESWKPAGGYGMRSAAGRPMGHPGDPHRGAAGRGCMGIMGTIYR
jgi:hypothetical protein